MKNKNNNKNINNINDNNINNNINNNKLEYLKLRLSYLWYTCMYDINWVRLRILGGIWRALYWSEIKFRVNMRRPMQKNNKKYCMVDDRNNEIDEMMDDVMSEGKKLGWIKEERCWVEGCESLGWKWKWKKWREIKGGDGMIDE